jgi:hypothetical protein
MASRRVPQAVSVLFVTLGFALPSRTALGFGRGQNLHSTTSFTWRVYRTVA